MRYDPSTPQSLREITEEDVERISKLEDDNECCEILCFGQSTAVHLGTATTYDDRCKTYLSRSTLSTFQHRWGWGQVHEAPLLNEELLALMDAGEGRISLLWGWLWIGCQYSNEWLCVHPYLTQCFILEEKKKGAWSLEVNMQGFWGGS